ncbi:hypothetical protein [Thomasclavelia cocleata]|uniref:hypothetical protein n=1 Tax=Thomasclavelia cocleata TaxID=69824 RepID=UPI00272C5338|nr:hypothetical protein [Thomasclavelia cocleata]
MILLYRFTVDNLEIDCVKMESKDLDKLVICKNIVSKEVPSNLFIPPNDTYLSTILSGYGKILGFLYSNKLIAFASIIFPKTGKQNLGKYLMFGNSQLNQVVQFEHGLVISAYRGHGLLKKLLLEHLKNIELKYLFFLSTVSPYNIPSLNTGFSLGQVIKSHISYHGFERFILYRKFTHSFSFEKALKCKNIIELDSYLNKGYVATYNFKEGYYLVTEEASCETV